MASNDCYVVALFDKPGEVDNVKRDLDNISGISASDADIHRKDASRGLVDRLTDHGVPRDHANFYAEGVRRGGHLVTLRTDDDHYKSVMDVMHQHGAVDIDRRASYYSAGGFREYDESAQPYTDEQTEEDRRGYEAHQYDGGPVLTETEEPVTAGTDRNRRHITNTGPRRYAATTTDRP